MAHTLGATSTRTSSTGNPITTNTLPVTVEDTVICLLLKVNGATNRAGGAPTVQGVAFTQANSTQKAAASPEASCELWYLENPCNPNLNPNAFPPGTYAATIPNTGALTVFYTFITGRAQAGGGSKLDGSNGSNNTSTNPTANAITVTQDGSFGVSVCCNGATDFDPATPSHTGFGTGTGSPLGTFDDGAHGGGQQYGLVNIGSSTFSWTFATVEDWGCVAAVFKEVPPVQDNKRLSVRVDADMCVGERAGFR